MIYGSVCSGIEAATVAWHPLGWKPSFFSEIEKFPRAVLQYHYPCVPLHGDFTTIKAKDYEPIDLLAGGTPCQSFSVAGLRGGMDDERGSLALEFIELAKRVRSRWIVWENVPGVLSSNRGYDFGSFIWALAKCGYGFAYRVLDAQYFGIPQDRRRVFVVGYFGDYRPAAAVLFESESLRGDPTPRKTARETVAPLTANGVGTCGPDDNQAQAGHLIATTRERARCLNAGGMGRQDFETETLISSTTYGVRRLTPRECERLQGLPDDYTQVPFRGKAAADGPRYKAIGNSMAVPVMRWIGSRIEMMEQTMRGVL